MDGYKITAGDATKGNMELSIPKSIHSLYDFSSASGKLYLFALDSGNEESFKDDTFKTCSNILETSF